MPAFIPTPTWLHSEDREEFDRVLKDYTTKKTKRTNGFADAPASKGVTMLVQADCWVKPTGSRVTTHFKDDSDYDYVVYDKNRVAYRIMEKLHAVIGGSKRAGSSFTSYRVGEENFIIVHSKEEFLKWQKATDLIRAVNPTTKEERIKLFDMIFEGDKQTEGVLF